MRLKVEQLRGTLVSAKSIGAVHVVPRGIVGLIEIGEIKVYHTPTAGHMDGSIYMVVAIIEDNSGILYTLDGV